MASKRHRFVVDPAPVGAHLSFHTYLISIEPSSLRRRATCRRQALPFDNLPFNLFASVVYPVPLVLRPWYKDHLAPSPEGRQSRAQFSSLLARRVPLSNSRLRPTEPTLRTSRTNAYGAARFPHLPFFRFASSSRRSVWRRHRRPLSSRLQERLVLVLCPLSSPRARSA